MLQNATEWDSNHNHEFAVSVYYDLTVINEVVYYIIDPIFQLILQQIAQIDDS